jgi:hypothetical protein
MVNDIVAVIIVAVVMQRRVGGGGKELWRLWVVGVVYNIE